MISKSKRDATGRVFRYDQHMPENDDLTLIVLKGHLLVEELLVELASLVLPNAQHLKLARLSFHQLACVVRSAVPGTSDLCWKLVLALNSLRNELAHKLDSPQRDARLGEIFELDEQVQVYPDMQFDKSDLRSCDDGRRLRQVVIDCMEFVASMIFDYQERDEKEVQ